MGDCTRNCKRSAESAEMETSSTTFSLTKRSKTVSHLQPQELELTSPEVDVQAGDIYSGLLSRNSSASRCSSNESYDILKDSFRFVDLEAKNFETEFSTCTNVNKFSRQTTPLSELCGDSDEMQSPEKKTPPSPAKPTKMPSQAEIDEFFSVAEKYEQKRFAEKYNYDIVKDLPLDGRYQWLPLNP